jgi:hypothetical protein
MRLETNLDTSVSGNPVFVRASRSVCHVSLANISLARIVCLRRVSDTLTRTERAPSAYCACACARASLSSIKFPQRLHFTAVQIPRRSTRHGSLLDHISTA